MSIIWCILFLFFGVGYLGIHTCGVVVCTMYAFLEGAFHVDTWHLTWFDAYCLVVHPLLEHYLVHTLWRWSTCYFGVLTTSFLVEHSIHLATCTFIHGVGYLGIHTCGEVVCMHSWSFMWTLGIWLGLMPIFWWCTSFTSFIWCILLLFLDEGEFPLRG
jgi:hypothetical protein